MVKILLTLRGGGSYSFPSIDIVIFLRDPFLKVGHHEDIQDLLEACNHNNIPLATNYASAQLIILGQIKKEDYERRKSMEE